MIKKIILIITGISTGGLLLACPVCERNQPKMLRGIVHGQGPDSQLDYLIIAVVAVIVLFAIYATIKALLRPGEQELKHIKRTVLED